MLVIVENKDKYKFCNELETLKKEVEVTNINFSVVDVSPKKGEGTFNYLKYCALVEYEHKEEEEDWCE